MTKMLIKNRTFDGGEVVLVDGIRFEECDFLDCRLVFRATAPFELFKNTFGPGHKWEFADAAALTLSVMSILHAGGFDRLIEATLNNIRNHNIGPSAGGGSPGPVVLN